MYLIFLCVKSRSERINVHMKGLLKEIQISSALFFHIYWLFIINELKIKKSMKKKVYPQAFL